MEPTAHLAALERESNALADAASVADLDAKVPGCPAWSLGDLVHHVGTMQRWAEATVRGRPERHQPDPSERPPDAGLAGWFGQGTTALLATLGAVSPDDNVWTFDPGDRTVRFWFRRTANETAVHRWDTQSASRPEPDPIEAELAADGVDEYLTAFVPMLHRRAPTPEAAAASEAGAADRLRFHFHRTDGPGEWLVGFGPEPGQVTVSTEHAKGDLAVRGPADDLLLFLWGRILAPTGQLEVLGDASLLDRWRALVPTP